MPALLIGHAVVSEISGLHHLAAGANDYFQPSHALLLYVVAPLVSVSAFSLYLLPGALLTLALGQARSVPALLVLSFGISILLTIALTTLAGVAFGEGRSPWAFMGLWVAVSAGAAAWLVYRTSQGKVPAHRLFERQGLRRLGWSVGMVMVGVVLLLPKIFWETFNVDGIEAFEFGRSLSSNIFPRWEVFEGVFGFYNNFWLFAYPNHWFISLLGPVEASVRLPLLLYTVLMFSALVLLIEHGRSETLRLREELVLWLGLALYTVVQAYNTTYDPFYADLAESGATDTLEILVFLAAVYFLWAGRTLWFIAFAMMTYFAVAGGLLLLALLGAFTFLAHPPQWWYQIRVIGLVGLVCVAITVLYDQVYTPLALGDAASQFSSTNLLRRLFPPTITEWVRFSALLFPTGLLPVAALFLARRSVDWRSWVVAGVTLGYFGLMYLQVWTSLHHFTPVMVIPLVVFWRLYLNWKPRIQQWALPALAITSMLFLFLSFPRHFQVSTELRQFGQATEFRIGDYHEDYETAAKASGTLWALLPSSYRIDYPNQAWSADEDSWVYYATREKAPGTEINYLVQTADEPAPQGFTRVSEEGGHAVYVKDFEQWERDRSPDVPQVVISPLYEPILRRTTQFFREYTQNAQGS